jgi:hypothetical protein
MRKREMKARERAEHLDWLKNGKGLDKAFFVAVCWIAIPAWLGLTIYAWVAWTTVGAFFAMIGFGFAVPLASAALVLVLTPFIIAGVGAFSISRRIYRWRHKRSEAATSQNHERPVAEAPHGIGTPADPDYIERLTAAGMILPTTPDGEQ